MYTAEVEQLSDRVHRYVLSDDGAVMTLASVVDAWSGIVEFRQYFSMLLASSPFKAFRWETPGATSSSLGSPFEFVLVDSPSLDRRPDRSAFAAQLGDGAEVVSFANLGGDAVMVVPAAIGDDAAYCHLASFLRLAPLDQRSALWAHVAAELGRRLSEVPVWLSTAGGGVAWLHVRLDNRPKYYHHRPYATIG